MTQRRSGNTGHFAKHCRRDVEICTMTHVIYQRLEDTGERQVAGKRTAPTLDIRWGSFGLFYLLLQQRERLHLLSLGEKNM